MNFLEKLKITNYDKTDSNFNYYIPLFSVNKNRSYNLEYFNSLVDKLGIKLCPEYRKIQLYFDGFEVAGFRFLTVSDDSYFETIEQLIAQFDEIYKDFEDEESPFKIGSGNLPIALDSGGNIIYLNKKGEVWIFYIDGGEHQFIASSFKEFMDEVVFGERYKDYYGLSDEEAEEDEWYQYLKLKGWVKG